MVSIMFLLVERGRAVNWTVDDIILWMNVINEKIHTNQRKLTELDQNIGDGDHGINMMRGFEKVVKNVNGSTFTSISDVLKEVSMSIITSVGGASGPLYGTAFLRFSFATKGIKVMDVSVLAKGINAALSGMKQRGRATYGEKTMIDVWKEVGGYLSHVDVIDVDELKQVAEQAMYETKAMYATKGRAAYLKQRSIGHIDPGAMSSCLIFLSLAEVLERGKAS